MLFSRSLSFVSAFVVILFFFLFAQSVFAQTATGIGIRPATVEEAVEPGVTYDYEINVTNLSGATQTYYLFTRDIIGVENAGQPIFADENAEKTGYELSEWIELGITEITLDAGEEGPAPFTVRVPSNATPGSHFGGLFVSLEPPRLRSMGAAVGYEVASILSLRVAGDVVENAQIRSFATDNYLYSSSEIDFHARIENLGNVLIRPVGPLEIHNMFGKRVALITFNDTQAGVFPKTTRDFEIIWEDEGPGFGRYEAILSVLYGQPGAQTTISNTATFWILPMDIILPALGILAFLLLVTFISIKLYIRRRLSAVTGRSKRLARRRQGSGLPLFLVILLVMFMVTGLFLVILLALFA